VAFAARFFDRDAARLRLSRGENSRRWRGRLTGRNKQSRSDRECRE
jgi:hypothetical protein